MDIRLSPHFTLTELTHTNHTAVDNTPPPEAVVRLTQLCREALEVIRQEFGPLRITSGYRSPALNAVIPGAAKDSAHSYGCAADLQSADGYDVTTIVRWIIEET